MPVGVLTQQGLVLKSRILLKSSSAAPMEMRKVRDRKSFFVTGVIVSMRCRCRQVMFSDDRSRLAAITFEDGLLTLQSSVDFLHLKVSCCLGPRQCTAAHLHKGSALANGNKAATTPLEREHLQTLRPPSLSPRQHSLSLQISQRVATVNISALSPPSSSAMSS